MIRRPEPSSWLQNNLSLITYLIKFKNLINFKVKTLLRLIGDRIQCKKLHLVKDLNRQLEFIAKVFLKNH